MDASSLSNKDTYIINTEGDIAKKEIAGNAKIYATAKEKASKWKPPNEVRLEV